MSARRKNSPPATFPAPPDPRRRTARRIAELPPDRQIAVYCQVGQRGYLATRILRQKGFNAVNIGGGYKTYQLFWPSNAAASGV